jgi:hypothetical protein
MRRLHRNRWALILFYILGERYACWKVRWMTGLCGLDKDKDALLCRRGTSPQARHSNVAGRLRPLDSISVQMRAVLPEAPDL